MKYTDLTFTELVEKIDGSRFFNLPKMIAEALRKIVSDTASPYKVYTAVLNQTDEEAPIATVLENTLGDIEWERLGEGSYLATLEGVFIEGKTYLVTGTLDFINHPAIVFKRVDENGIGLQVSVNDVQADNFVLDFSIEIRVYN